MAATNSRWDTVTSLQLDTSFDFTAMLSDNGKLSLSDIVAATIGETDNIAPDSVADARSNTALVPDVTENSNSCDSNSQFYSNDTKNEDTIHKADISELFSDNSNACDSFSFGSIMNPGTKCNILSNNAVGSNLYFPTLKTEEKMHSQKEVLAIKMEEKFDINKLFFDFRDTASGVVKKTHEKNITDQQVVPKLEESKSKEAEGSGMKEINYSTTSFDSDLEDSMQFVEPDDYFTTADAHEDTHPNEPRTKRFRPSVADSSTCPFPKSAKQENMLSDFKPENSMPSDLNKSFSTQFVTPVNSRSRSLSEACNRDESSPLGESRFNVSLTSLLGSPLSESPLSNNPFFSDLKTILESDCKKIEYPVTLFEALSDKQNQDVYARERNLQAKFSYLQSRYPEEVRKLSSFYRCQSAEVETERFKQLHGDNVPASYRNYLNDYYDEQLHKIMDRVEKSVKVLSEAKEVVNPPMNRMYLKSRPLLSRKAVAMMDEWYTRNFEHPYPSQSAVDALAKAGEISVEQVKKWFANKRNRCKNTKPQTEIANMKRKRQYSSRW